MFEPMKKMPKEKSSNHLPDKVVILDPVARKILFCPCLTIYGQIMLCSMAVLLLIATLTAPRSILMGPFVSVKLSDTNNINTHVTIGEYGAEKLIQTNNFGTAAQKDTSELLPRLFIIATRDEPSLLPRNGTSDAGQTLAELGDVRAAISMITPNLVDKISETFILYRGSHGKTLIPNESKECSKITWRNVTTNGLSLFLYDKVITGPKFEQKSSQSKITLVTQSTLDRVHSFVLQSASWKGASSVAIMVAADYEYVLLRGFIGYIKRCLPDAYSMTTFHVVSTEKLELCFLLAVYDDFDQLPCSGAESSIKKIMEKAKATGEFVAKKKYPQNVMRNHALMNRKTEYYLMLDIDIVPSRGAENGINKFLTKYPDLKNPLVLPTYEVSEKAPIPENKKELLRLVQSKLAQPFHKTVSAAAQRATNFSKWEKIHDAFMDVYVPYPVEYELHYEPFFVANFRSPLYNQNLVGFGFTRSIHALETNLKQGPFMVMSPIFTFQPGLIRFKEWSAQREEQNEENAEKFQQIVAKLCKKPACDLREYQPSE